jgi:hypothetical protein
MSRKKAIKKRLAKIAAKIVTGGGRGFMNKKYAYKTAREKRVDNAVFAGRRYYLGDETCGSCLFRYESFTQEAESLCKKGAEVTFVTPCLTVRREKYLYAFLDRVLELAQKYSGVELAINDFGVFSALREMRARDRLVVSLGRLLFRQVSDPRVYMPGDDSVSFLSRSALETLLKIAPGLNRAELDNNLSGVNPGRDFPLKISVHLDGVIVTVKSCGDDCLKTGKICEENGLIHDNLIYDKGDVKSELYSSRGKICYDNRKLCDAADRFVVYTPM